MSENTIEERIEVLESRLEQQAAYIQVLETKLAKLEAIVAQMNIAQEGKIK